MPSLHAGERDSRTETGGGDSGFGGWEGTLVPEGLGGKEFEMACGSGNGRKSAGFFLHSCTFVCMIYSGKKGEGDGCGGC